MGFLYVAMLEVGHVFSMWWILKWRYRKVGSVLQLAQGLAQNLNFELLSFLQALRGP